MEALVLASLWNRRIFLDLFCDLLQAWPLCLALLTNSYTQPFSSFVVANGRNGPAIAV